MDFLFLFDCDCLRHKEGIRCTLVNADSYASINIKMSDINYVALGHICVAPRNT